MLSIAQLVCGLTLLLVFFSGYVRASSCGEFASVPDATSCFNKHRLLHTYIERSDSGRVFSNRLVQRKLKDIAGGFAVAFLDKGEACAVQLSKSTETIFVRNSVLTSEFATSVLEPIRENLAIAADDDCVIEVHETLDKIYAVVDYVTQSHRDGVHDGLFLAIAANETIVSPVHYLKHGSSSQLGQFRYSSPAFAQLAVKVEEGRLVFVLAPSGYVTKDVDTRFNATYINGNTHKSAVICTQDELKQRHPMPNNKLKELIAMSDEEIAIRAIPDSWYEPLDFDPSAYVLCRGAQ